MKVDQYRIQKAKEEYSFLVPAGTDLGDFDEPQKGWLQTFLPYVLERRDVDLETIAEGPDMATVLGFIERDGMVAVLTRQLSTDVEPDDDAIE